MNAKVLVPSMGQEVLINVHLSMSSMNSMVFGRFLNYIKTLVLLSFTLKHMEIFMTLFVC